jgi:hypothetical protein
MGSLKRRKGRQSIARQEFSDDCQIPSIPSKIAIFGNSHLALVASFVMLILSMWVAILLNSKSSQVQGFVPKLPTRSTAKIYKVDEIKGGLLSQRMLKEYQQDGVIAIRGLVDKELLDRLDVASQKYVQDHKMKKKRARGTQFFQVEIGIALGNQAFQDVALVSQIPLMAATLLQLSENSTMRMMRDIFLVKDNDQYICGWHTDDTGFWPATGAAPGVNAWIALDDMPSAGGGGFALAVGSHRASWRHEAHKVTGSTLTLPKQGFRDVADMFANRTGSGTCNIKTSAPHLHHRMEESMRVYDVKRGDVIFHDRWLFHRTVPFDRQVPRLVEDPLYRRYSVRYGPGSSIIPPGYGLELSVLWDERNSGRSADQVSNLDGPWYPRVWPSVIASELEQIPSLIREKLPVAEASRKVRREEMKPYLAELRKKHETE